MTKSREFLDKLQVGGAISFTTVEYRKALGVGEIAARHSLHRLRRQRLIASPLRGFHLVLPASDRAAGCRPPDEFVDYLMRCLGDPYYTAMLSAAEIHGAAHHRPQVFQVMTVKNRRAIRCGRVRVAFYARSGLEDMPTIRHKVSTGYIKVSTPEVTALDLVGHHAQSGGLDNVATVLAELAEVLSAEKLRSVSQLFEIAWVQRLGFLLEVVGAGRLTDGLAKTVRERAVRATPLLPGKRTPAGEISKRWRVIVNETVEPDL